MRINKVIALKISNFGIEFNGRDYDSEANSEGYEQKNAYASWLSIFREGYKRTSDKSIMFNEKH